jgi:hypothetical protein
MNRGLGDLSSAGLAVSLLLTVVGCSSAPITRAEVATVQAVACSFAITHVERERVERGWSREMRYVVDDALWSDLKRLVATPVTLIRKSEMPVFPIQKSSDTGMLFLRVGVGEPQSKFRRMVVPTSFYVGVENATGYSVTVRKSETEWTATTIEVDWGS